MHACMLAWGTLIHTEHAEEAGARTGGREEGQGGARGGHQVAADPGIDKAEGEDSELEELGTAVVGQEAQAARQHTPGQRHRHSQAAAQGQGHPAQPQQPHRPQEKQRY